VDPNGLPYISGEVEAVQVPQAPQVAVESASVIRFLVLQYIMREEGGEVIIINHRLEYQVVWAEEELGGMVTGLLQWRVKMELQTPEEVEEVVEEERVMAVMVVVGW